MLYLSSSISTSMVYFILNYLELAAGSGRRLFSKFKSKTSKPCHRLVAQCIYVCVCIFVVFIALIDFELTLFLKCVAIDNGT